MTTIRILCIGDVVGQAGRAVFQKHIPAMRRELSIDAVIVNGENSAKNGRGITPRNAQFFKHNGADVITSGNHIWASREIYSYIAQHTDLLRPVNFPSSCPGSGFTLFECKGKSIAVVNIQGRVFMKENLDCPFKAMDSLLTYLSTRTHIIIVDMHAEATSEKIALGYYLDGRVSSVFGTHTHVQTADERILPRGTAFISDLGMVGSLNSSLGMKKDIVIQGFLTQMPVKFAVEMSAPFVLSGIWVDIDIATGRAVRIERVRIIDNNLYITEDGEHE